LTYGTNKTIIYTYIYIYTPIYTYNRPPRAHRGSSITLLIPDLGARRGCVVITTPRPPLPPGGWVGLRVGLDVYEKLSPPPGFDPWTVQGVDSRYTD
jgi:hypothetical protein